MFRIQKLFSEWIWSTWTSYLSFRWAAWKIMTLILQISHFWPAEQRNHHYTILLICCTQNGFKALFKLLFDVYFRPFCLLFDALLFKRIKNQANLDKKYRKKQVSLDHIYLFFLNYFVKIDLIFDPIFNNLTSLKGRWTCF